MMQSGCYKSRIVWPFLIKTLMDGLIRKKSFYADFDLKLAEFYSGLTRLFYSGNNRQHDTQFCATTWLRI